MAASNSHHSSSAEGRFRTPAQFELTLLSANIGQELSTPRCMSCCTFHSTNSVVSTTWHCVACDGAVTPNRQLGEGRRTTTANFVRTDRYMNRNIKTAYDTRYQKITQKGSVGLHHNLFLPLSLSHQSSLVKNVSPSGVIQAVLLVSCLTER